MSEGHIPECIVCNPVFLQDGKELLFHAPINSTVVALVDRGLGIAIGLAHVNELLQQLWLEVGDTEPELLAMSSLFSNLFSSLLRHT